MNQVSASGEMQQQRSFEDMRGAQRFTLLIRTAKLVSERSEFLCISRDVSETGLRLRLFHALPAQGRMAIELSNGEVYFIERVWERDDHAGFRFAAPIDVHAFINEVSPYPRRQVRLRMQLPATVSADGQTSAAKILDLSQAGIRIETDRYLAMHQQVRLQADGMPTLFAKVCWRSGTGYGLVLQTSFQLEELAKLAGRLQAGNAVPPPPDKAVRYA